MSSTFLNLAFIFLAIIEIGIGVYVLIGDSRAARNRGIALLLLLFGVSNIANGALVASVSLSGALLWMGLFVATAYMIGPSIYLASVMILRPDWLRHRWLYGPISLFTFSPPVVVLIDSFFSRILPQPLLFVPPQAQSYFGGVLVLAELTSNSYTRTVYSFAQIVLPALALVCPMLVVALKDRTADPGNSRAAWTLAVVTALTAAGQVVFGDALDAQLLTLISNFLHLLGFTWIIFRVQNASFGLRRIQQSLDDWQVLSKMMLVVLTIVIPTVLAITLVASSLLRASMIQQAGGNLSALVSVEAGTISDELQSQVASIQRLADSSATIDTLRQRLDGYAGLDDKQVQSQLAGQEFSWVSGEMDGSDMESLLISAPEMLTELLNFLNTFPNYHLLIVTDASGALVTATQVPPHYDFSNAGWWRKAASGGAGGLYISPPSTRLSDQTHFVRFAVPVRDPANGAFLGAILGDYSLRPMLNKLVAADPGGEGHSDLYGPSGILVPHHDAQGHGMLENGAPFRWDRLLTSGQTWEILPFDGQSSIVSWAPVEGGLAGPGIGWRLAIHQPVDAALSGLASASRATIIAAGLALGLALILTWALANYITQPLSGLARVADRIREGDLFVSAPSDRKDEFGSLAATFNTMTARLRETVSGLESQVRRRTSDLERQTRQLQAAVQVGQAASSILDLDSLLQTVVDVIRENFDLYYVGLFLTDVDREWAVLEAGTGEAGKAMLARGHRMRVGEGMVGWSIQNAQARIARQAEEDIIRLQTSELPDTRSEAALPLRARGQTIGALTVQSDRPEEFGLATTNILQTMADQVAIAIDNANLLAENQSALDESQKALETVRRTYTQISQEAWTTLSRQRGLDFVAKDTGKHHTGPLSTRPKSNGRTGAKEVSLPLQIRDFPAGVIKLQKSDPADDWSDEEIQMMNAYAEQLALTLESARLFQDTQLRTIQLQTSAEISQAASSILDLEKLLPEAVELIGERFDLYYTGLFLVSDDGKWAELQAGTGEAGQIQLSEHHRLAVGGNSMIGQCIVKGIAQIALDVGEQAVRFDNPHLPDTRTEMAIPLNTRGETIGALTVQSIYPAAFSSEDVRVFQTMADQLANAIQNARLYAQSQESAEDAQKQSRISQALVKSSVRFNQAQEMDQVFEIITQEIVEQINPDQVNILSWEDELQAFKVLVRHIPGSPADNFEVGQQVSRQDRPDLWDVYNRSAKIYTPETRPDGLVHEQYRIPLLLTGKPFGVVEAFHTASGARIRDEDQSIIDGIILQADIALQNARAFRQMQEALSRTEALYRVGQSAIAAEEVSRMLQNVVETITSALPADRVVLCTVDHEEEKIVHFMQHGEHLADQSRPTYRQLLDGFTGWVLREGKPILSTKGKMDRRENERILRARQAAGFGSVVVVPLISRGRALGVITAMNGTNKPDFTPQDTDLLMAMANQTAVAVQNAELLQETQKTAENETRLNQIGTQLIQSLDVDTILRTAVEEISRLPSVRRVSLTLGDSEPGSGEGGE